MEKPVAENIGGQGDPKPPGWQRHIFMVVVSAVIVILVIAGALGYPEMIYGRETGNLEALVPFITCLVGVLLFILGVSRRKRAGWSLREYLGDHCYRIAQAFAYLFIVLWAWSRWRSSVQSTEVPPNIIGFLVGFFILRVERAMESLGEKFEEALMSILPRSVTYMTVQERRRQALRNTYRLEDVMTQYQALRPMIENEAVRQDLDKKLARATEAAAGEDPQESDKWIGTLVREFEDVKQGLNESIVPLDELLTPAELARMTPRQPKQEGKKEGE